MQSPRPLLPFTIHTPFISTGWTPPWAWLAVPLLATWLAGGCTPPAPETTGCDLPYDQRAIDLVSMGAVTVGTQPGDPSTFTAQVDATAGGSSAAGRN